MRRAELQVKTFDETVAILEKCDTVRMGIFGEEYPYVVPLSFGFDVTDGRLNIYFHGAMEGLKHELLEKNPNVCDEADIMHGFVSTGPQTTADYESVIGFGRAEVLDGDEAVKGIELIMAHCGQPGFDGRLCTSLGITKIYRIALDSISGKKRFAAGKGPEWK